MDVPLILAVCVLFGVVVVLGHAFFARRRSQDLQREASRLGFSFEPTSHPFQNSNVEGLTVLDAGSATLAENVLRGRISEANIVIFDVVLSTVAETPITVTCAAFHATRAELPTFQVRTKYAWEKLGEVLGQKAAAFENTQPDSAPDAVLLCPDQMTKRAFFTPRRLQRLRAGVHDFRIESSPEWLVIYRPGRKVKPRELPQFVHATSSVASALLYQDAA